MSEKYSQWWNHWKIHCEYYKEKDLWRDPFSYVVFTSFCIFLSVFQPLSQSTRGLARNAFYLNNLLVGSRGATSRCSFVYLRFILHSSVLFHASIWLRTPHTPEFSTGGLALFSSNDLFWPTQGDSNWADPQELDQESNTWEVGFYD